jgi:hypothetical protein
MDDAVRELLTELVAKALHASLAELVASNRAVCTRRNA